MEKTTNSNRRRGGRKPPAQQQQQQQQTIIMGKNSPGLDRFDDLLNRLRKSTLEKENPFPSIHAPKPKPPPLPPTQIISPLKIKEQHEQEELPTEEIAVEPVPDAKNPPCKHTHSFSNNKPPLSTPPQPPSSVIVNLSSSSSTTTTTTTTTIPLNQPSPSVEAEAETETETAAATATSPLTSSTENSKLDWASLVEAARQSDAEEDQLPDLTEWATSPNDHNQHTSAEEKQQQNKHLISWTHPDSLAPAAQLHVQSRDEIVGSMGRLVKIQLGGAIHSSSSSSAVKTTDRSEEPSILTKSPPTTTVTPPVFTSDADDNNADAKTTKADPPATTASVPHRRQLLQSPLSSSSRLLNQKQKQSIARLIMPVSPLPSSSSASPSSSSTTANTTTTTTNTDTNTNAGVNLLASSSLTPTPVSSHLRPIHPALISSSSTTTTVPPAVASSSSTAPSHVVAASLSLNEQSSAHRKDVPVRLVDSVALRLVSGRLSCNAKSNPVTAHSTPTPTVDNLKALSSGPDSLNSTTSDQLFGPMKQGLDDLLAPPAVSSTIHPSTHSSCSVKLTKKKVKQKKLVQRSLVDPSSSSSGCSALTPIITSSSSTMATAKMSAMSLRNVGDDKKKKKKRAEKKSKLEEVINSEAVKIEVIKNDDIKNEGIKNEVIKKEEKEREGMMNRRNLPAHHLHPSHPTQPSPTNPSSSSSTTRKEPAQDYRLHHRETSRHARSTMNPKKPSINLFDKLTGGGLLKS